MCVTEVHSPQQVHVSSAAPLAHVMCVTSGIPSLSVTSVPACHLDIESSPEVLACPREGAWWHAGAGVPQRSAKS